MQITNRFVLMLTASVDPKGMAGVSRPSPNEREEDYRACLRYYVRNHPHIKNIVFVENSGWPLERIREAVEENPHGKKVEFLQFSENEFPRHLGKSYGELLMMDRAMASSALAREARYVAKLTGRNYLLNLTTLLERAPESFELLCDLRDHPFFEWLGRPDSGRRCDTRFLVFTPWFYDTFVRGKYVLLNETAGFFIEGLFYHIAKNSFVRARVVHRLPVEPEYAGIAGHLNPDGTVRDYGSRGIVMKRRLRAVARRLAPWLYI